MYKTIYVPVDNSDYSNAAIDLALTFGKAFSASLVGSHVYAAKLHDVRFKQMEFTLPDEYSGFRDAFPGPRLILANTKPARTAPPASKQLTARWPTSSPPLPRFTDLQ